MLITFHLLEPIRLYGEVHVDRFRFICEQSPKCYAQLWTV